MKETSYHVEFKGPDNLWASTIKFTFEDCRKIESFLHSKDIVARIVNNTKTSYIFNEAENITNTTAVKELLKRVGDLEVEAVNKKDKHFTFGGATYQG